MTGLYVALALVVVIGVMLWRAKRAGVAEAHGKAAEEAVEQIVEANKPVDTSQRERLRSRYRRD